ncbi:MAG TPA: hypothetical protein VGL94_02875, partial [Ktedonobacteraceae bacterium]
QSNIMLVMKKGTDNKKTSHPKGRKVFPWYHPDFSIDFSTLKLGRQLPYLPLPRLCRYQHYCSNLNNAK